MKMTYRFFAALSLLLWCSRLLAAESTAETTPEELLKSKGLSRVGVVYLVELESKLPDYLRTVRAAQRRLENHAARRTAIERDIETADAGIADWNQQVIYTDDKLSRTNKDDTVKYNTLVGQRNALRARVTEAERFKESRTKELTKLGDSPDDYVALLIDLAEQMETASARYAELAADSDVKAAIAKLNVKGSPKVRLGPSSQFAEELPLVRKRRDKIKSSVITFRMEGGVPTVNVTLNGSLTQPMTFDSGAAEVVLTWDVAQRLKLSPARGEPVIRLRVADGTIREAKVMVIKTVQLGPFKVENVECAVFPQSMKGGSNLLGGTFLKNFVVRMDLGAREIRLSQMSGKPTGPEVATVGANTAGASSKPSSAPADREISVSATHGERIPVPTGVSLTKGQSITINVNGGDRWSKGDGPHKGHLTDYRGYADSPGSLAMKWKIGASTGNVQSGAVIVAPEAGQLLLFCADDKPAGNSGAIRAVVSIKFKPVEHPNQSADDVLTRKLNDLDEWTIKAGTWRMSDGRLRGEGDTRIDFNSPLPADCTLRCRINVVSGMRPRIYFDGTNLMYGNEGYTKHFFPELAEVTEGKAFPYENNEEHAIVFKFSGANFAIEMDGKPAFVGTRKVADSIHLYLRGGDDWSRGTTEFWDFKLEPAPVLKATTKPSESTTQPMIVIVPAGEIPNAATTKPSGKIPGNLFNESDTEEPKPKASAATMPAKETAAQGRTIKFTNSSDAMEGMAILTRVAATYPEVLKSVTEAELVRYHNGTDFKRGGGEPRMLDDSYSAMPAAGKSDQILFCCIYEKWEPGKYLFVYRIQPLSAIEGNEVYFLDVCRGGGTVAARLPAASELTAGQWAVMPVLYEPQTEETLEYRLWPKGKEIALDRFYIFKMR
jgi:clan AA aspartic protease (TIGR02281 family)